MNNNNKEISLAHPLFRIDDRDVSSAAKTIERGDTF